MATQEEPVQKESEENELHSDQEFSCDQLAIEKLELKDVLGYGSVATVYKVTQKLLDRTVAVKILSRNNFTRESTINRFQQEAKLSSRLKHPNIATVLAYGVSRAGDPYLIMDFADGSTLAEELKKPKCLSLKRFKEIFLPILSALDYAHREGIVHRDIKPSNIILAQPNGKELVPILVDFGIAKAFIDLESNQHITTTGNLVGTPSYMSPEQCAGKDLDGRSDLYSLACILYEFLCGEPPFKANTSFELMSRHIHSSPPSAAELSREGGIENKLATVIVSALAKNPSQRPGTASEFSNKRNEALGQYTTDRLSLPERKQRAKGSRKIAASSFVIVITLIFTVGFLAIKILEEQARRKRETKAALAQTEQSLNQQLSKSAQVKMNSVPLINDSLNNCMNAIKKLEARKKFHKDLLLKEYCNGTTLAFTLAHVTGITKERARELLSISRELSERGLALAVEINDQQKFFELFDNELRTLQNNKSGAALVLHRVERAQTKWPRSSETLNITSRAFAHFMAYNDLKNAELIADQLAQAEKFEMTPLQQAWARSGKSIIAIAKGKKASAQQLLIVLHSLPDLHEGDFHVKFRLIESCIKPGLYAVGEKEEFANGLEKELQENFTDYNNQSGYLSGRIAEMLADAMEAIGKKQKAIHYNELAIDFLDMGDFKYTLEDRYSRLIQLLEGSGPLNAKKAKEYRKRLDQIRQHKK